MPIKPENDCKKAYYQEIIKSVKSLDKFYIKFATSSLGDFSFLFEEVNYFANIKFDEWREENNSAERVSKLSILSIIANIFPDYKDKLLAKTFSDQAYIAEVIYNSLDIAFVLKKFPGHFELLIETLIRAPHLIDKLFQEISEISYIAHLISFEELKYDFLYCAVTKTNKFKIDHKNFEEKKEIIIQERMALIKPKQFFRSSLEVSLSKLKIDPTSIVLTPS